MKTPLSIPPFSEYREYNELSPKNGKFKYRFITLKYITLRFQNNILPDGVVISYYDEEGEEWMKMTSDSIIIFPNYAWDGCTPKKWWKIWWGSPDFQDTILASLVHDALLQFLSTDDFPFSRDECDLIFREIMMEESFELAQVYYLGARIGTKILPNKKYYGKSTLTINHSD